MNLIPRLFILSTLAFASGCSKPDLADPNVQESYAIGREVGETFVRQEMKINQEAFAMGLRDALKGEASKLDAQVLAEASSRARGHAMRKFQDSQAKAAENLRASETYLAENKKKPEVKTTSSGLQYEVMTMGSGAKAKDGQMVEVHYEGKLIDGTVFDSSIARKVPAEFNIDQVISGWKEVLKLMPIGSKWKVTIPPALGYKEAGMPPKIPPNSVLVFEIELLKVSNPPKAP